MIFHVHLFLSDELLSSLFSSFAAEIDSFEFEIMPLKKVSKLDFQVFI